MTLDPSGVTDSELHALADGQLPEPRRWEVEAYVDENPDAARQVEAYRRLNNALAKQYDSVLDEEIPPRLRYAATPARTPVLSRAAMAAGLALFGGVMGWMLKTQFPDQTSVVIAARNMDELTRSAAFAHAVYTPEIRHPVEVGADQQAHLVNWLSKRLKASIRAPDLTIEGFELVGGRLLPSSNRMAAQFMYQDSDGIRVTLYLRKGNWQNLETAFRYDHVDGIGVFFWIDGPLGYALSGELPKDRLLRLANEVYRHLNP